MLFVPAFYYDFYAASNQIILSDIIALNSSTAHQFIFIMESNMVQPKTTQSVYLNPKAIISTLLVLAGLIVSSYLFNHYLEMVVTQNQTNDVCSTVFGKSCDNALTSSYSSVLGLPLAAWGIIYYTSIVMLWFLPVVFGKEFKTFRNLVIYVATFIALLAALVLLSLMLIHREIFCPFCAMVHGINILLFFFINQITGFSFKETIPTIRRWLHGLFSPKIKETPILWKLFGFAACLFLFGTMYFLMYTLTIQNSTDEGFIEAKPVLDGFYSQKVQQIPVAPEDPRLGPDKSMINIVVFSDFLCPACKRFSKELQKINEEGQGKYSIVFKNFPLSTNCNHAILKDLHPQSCEAAYAGVAANMQGKFWEFHDALFNVSGRGYDDFSRTIALRAGLDMQRFDSARHTAAVKDKITRDVLLAQQLNIDATPTVFLNGRLVTDMRPGILGILVHQELKRINLVDSLLLPR